MFGVVDVWAYVGAVVLLTLLPGPNSMYVLSVAARRGLRPGFIAAGGVFVGDSVLMAASALGLSSLFAASPTLFTIVKWAGAAYLSWIALGMLRSAWTALRTKEKQPDQTELLSKEHPFRRAFTASILNPKSLLFYVALFVQFIDPSYAYPVLSYLVLMVIVLAIDMMYMVSLIFFGDRLARIFRRRRRAAAAGNATVGAALMAFAAVLLAN
ncbi:leucine efflux protein LeuE [Natronoglycomyces albus]|uniref:Leucine efflux protein LeuE n=1 Tax=Natronoglycomyces albus TaxID=2811108 RepID=A0A895XUT3_9ACTN|nr:leucine efflux protein LeuE [Natronoglycomyces albus]QSB06286.1 leucine efflux protein LeuE [Natronoglycomyces albus]